MQGQRSTMELDQGSSSSNSTIDPQVYWSNVLNPMDTRDIADCLLSPDDTIIPFTNVTNPESGGFSGWNFNNPESSRNATNRTSLDEAKRDHEWSSTMVSSSGTSPSLHEGRFEAGNMLSLENTGINIANDQITSGQEYNSLQNTTYTAEIVNSNGQLSVPCHLFNSCGPDSQPIKSVIGSTNSCSTSAGNRYLPEEVDGRLRGSLDSQHISGKRKMIEGASGQSSTSGIVNHLHQGENSQHTVSVGNSLNSGLNISNSSNNLGTGIVQGINPSSGTVSRAGISGSLSSAGAAGNAENTHRNVRRRANPALEHDLFLPHLWPSGNSFRHSNDWPPRQPSVVIPFVQLPEVVPPVSASVSQSQPNVPTIPSLPQNPHPFAWNGSSNSRADSSSSSPVVSGERFPSRRIVRSIPIPVTDMRRLAQDPSNWNLSTGNLSPLENVASTSRTGPSSASNPSVPPTWPPHQIPHMQYPLRSSEYSRRSLQSIGSDSGVQNNTIHLPDPSHSTSPQEIIPNQGTGLRSQQRQLLRSAFLMDRQNDGLPGVPLALRMAALREGRSRVISEQIRSALDVLRRGLPYEFVRGDNLRLESLIFGGADLHDRHRDMRLDVDNMSYEELLALEERIGNVNTGLTEETVMKHLKQWNYTANSVEVSQDAEPCCICQEEYAEDEDLGTLHCGHNFHSECIKQWLSHKNLCPICKTTALIT